MSYTYAPVLSGDAICVATTSPRYSQSRSFAVLSVTASSNCGPGIDSDSNAVGCMTTGGCGLGPVVTTSDLPRSGTQFFIWGMNERGGRYTLKPKGDPILIGDYVTFQYISPGGAASYWQTGPYIGAFSGSFFQGGVANQFNNAERVFGNILLSFASAGTSWLWNDYNDTVQLQKTSPEAADGDVNYRAWVLVSQNGDGRFDSNPNPVNKAVNYGNGFWIQNVGKRIDTIGSYVYTTFANGGYPCRFSTQDETKILNGETPNVSDPDSLVFFTNPGGEIPVINADNSRSTIKAATARKGVGFFYNFLITIGFIFALVIFLVLSIVILA